MIRAVLFDWGNTLASWTFDAAVLEQGHAAGLKALGVDVSITLEALTVAYADLLLPELLAERDDEIDYVAAVTRLLAGLGCEVDGEGVWRFVTAEHAIWETSHRLAPAALSVLDALRRRGLLVGLVSNLFDPPALSRARLASLGVLDRLDAVALSAEVGARKPDAAIFEAALEELGVAADDAVFVGDRIREDVGGASALGMRTILAAWFARDATPGPMPDARADALGEVLVIVNKWQKEVDGA